MEILVVVHILIRNLTFGSQTGDLLVDTRVDLLVFRQRNERVPETHPHRSQSGIPSGYPPVPLHEFPSPWLCLLTCGVVLEFCQPSVLRLLNFCNFPYCQNYFISKITFISLDFVRLFQFFFFLDYLSVVFLRQGCSKKHKCYLFFLKVTFEQFFIGNATYDAPLANFHSNTFLFITIHSINFETPLLSSVLPILQCDFVLILGFIKSLSMSRLWTESLYTVSGFSCIFELKHHMTHFFWNSLSYQLRAFQTNTSEKKNLK